MSKPLSFSGYQTYVNCGAEYKKKYIDGIWPDHEMSWFIYGRACDIGFNALVLGEKDYKKQAQDVLSELKIKNVEFIKADYDGEILSAKTLNQILKLLDRDESIGTLFEIPFHKLTSKQKQCLNYACYESLKVKLDLTLKSFQVNVLPKIEKAKDVQKQIEWKDKKGNKFKGIIDLRVKMDGKIYLADNKTSGNPNRDYPESIANDALQFAIYSGQTKDKNVCYFVFSKKVKLNKTKICGICEFDGTGKQHHTCNNIAKDGKRCNGEWIEEIDPEIECIIRTGEISDKEKEFAQAALTSVAEAIKAGHFHKNLKSCKTFYGDKEVKCPFYDNCRNGSTEGLNKGWRK